MNNALIIIESPNKVPAIKSFLGKGYKVAASVGHVRDLPKSKLGIDVEHNYEPQYMNIRGKGEVISSLKKEAKKADIVYLATDPDREGEAISWHLEQALGLDPEKTRRITFGEVTRSAFREALKHPRDIDMNLVNAQQTRRILDRLVGYKISPFLWKKIESGLSAGRVQSVATRIIVEREDEIQSFVPEEYWTLTALLSTANGEEFTARYHGSADKKLELKNESDVKKVLDSVKGAKYTVESVKKSVKAKRPLPPFNTSTLQQEANRRLAMSSSRTMLLAQELYEGVNLGERGIHGLISYMRTDSVRISDEARDAAKKFIVSRYGDSFYPETPNVYKAKKGIQDAHEAIRPSDPSLTPETVRSRLSNDAYRLYKLIWERFIASQMKAAELNTVNVDIEAGGNIFKAAGKTVRFMGYMAVYGYTDDDDEEENGKLPALAKGDILEEKKLLPEQRFTQPPSRYTEGSLVKALEDMGIGRPSTFAATISTIIARKYVQHNGKFLEPTTLGRVTNGLMLECFPKIVDYDFTANMETDLDKIEEGSEDYLKVIDDFYKDFVKQLSYADEHIDRVSYEKPVEYTDIICEKCGARMIVKEGKYGKFAACPNYPSCRNAKRLAPDGKTEKKPDPVEEGPEVVADEKCPKCGKDMVLRKGTYGPYFACRDYPACRTTMPVVNDSGVKCPKCGKRLLIKQTRTKKTFYSCEDYPKCDFSCWDIPLDEKCPRCGSMLLKKKSLKKGRNTVYCSNTECTWREENGIVKE